MTGRVAALPRLHGRAPGKVGAEPIPNEDEAADLHRALDSDEIRELAGLAIDSRDPGDRDGRREVLLCLACLRPGSLDGLHFGGTPRPRIESANWLVPGVRFSQVGGHPTWIQDAEYPRCPDCGRTMPFVAQLSNEDIEEGAEGIYSIFACRECGVAATGYQRT